MANSHCDNIPLILNLSQEECSVRDLAKKASVSKTTLSRIIKRHLTTRPGAKNGRSAILSNSTK
jgi:DNA-binding MarR family transcriptional regulator